MTPCEVCGTPCGSKYSVCRENKDCRREYRRRAQDAMLERIRVDRPDIWDMMPEREEGPTACELCGGPLNWGNATGVCSRNPECEREQRRRDNRLRRARPEVRERERASRREYHRNNLEQEQEYARRWREDNPDLVRAQRKRRYQKDLEGSRARGRERYQADHDAILERNNDYRIAMRSTVEGTARLLFLGTRARARKRGLPFDLTAEWVESELALALENGCPLLGIEITLGTGPRSPSVPSIDRFRPELGYVQANCWILSFAANNMKHDMTIDFIRKVAALADTRFKGVA